MQKVVTITSQGQITIPAAMRRKLGITTSERVWVELKDNKIVIDKPETIFDIAGTFKPKRKLSVLKAREYMQKNYERT